MSELFAKPFATEAEVNAILAREARLHFGHNMGPDDPEYLTRHRRLLGPEADITHPEFGRTNRREEILD